MKLATEQIWKRNLLTTKRTREQRRKFKFQWFRSWLGCVPYMQRCAPHTLFWSNEDVCKYLCLCQARIPSALCLLMFRLMHAFAPPRLSCWLSTTSNQAGLFMRAWMEESRSCFDLLSWTFPCEWFGIETIKGPIKASSFIDGRCKDTVGDGSDSHASSTICPCGCFLLDITQFCKSTEIRGSRIALFQIDSTNTTKLHELNIQPQHRRKESL